MGVVCTSTVPEVGRVEVSVDTGLGRSCRTDVKGREMAAVCRILVDWVGSN